ncbi:M14 family metallopeptidase [Serratia sp. Ag1]|uniref:M14 family metallopeptidase n=1 Tax=Serratia sp. Ag1 TaxID=1524467 RepID=UPI0005005552|nr:M14 family metallopeptidase [Serratia sp. Ag1]KFK98012.1 peptidase M14 [Serratia sp. Ag1]
MSIVFQQSIERSLEQLVARFSDPAMRGATVEAWLFDDRQSRQAAARQLQACGVNARLRSAYKPLLHFFLEEVDCQQLAAITLRYPNHPAAAKNRFLLETYPLTKLVDKVPVQFHASEKDDCTYEVMLTFHDGHQEQHAVFAPNRLHQDSVGQTLLSPTGWLTVVQRDTVSSERFETDIERLFQQIMTAIGDYDWGEREPYFEELNIAVQLAVKEQPLAYGHEVISLAEALHEDIYFSLLEVFQQKSGRPLGDRGLQPGQIVPEISYTDGNPSVCIRLCGLSTQDASGVAQELTTAAAPLYARQITEELTRLGGEIYTAASRSGRIVYGSYTKGSDQPMMISAGQHANETSGVVGALRAAQQLHARQGAHFTLSPQENPDGYALHQRLCAVYPHHMHHAARYTALGDDLEYRTGEALWEKAIRVQAQALTGSRLHVNLHGYPSHEWTRPFSGYLPRGFEMWTLPKGFFLIVNHHAGWARQAERLLDAVTRQLAAIDGLVADNNVQIALFEECAGETGFRLLNGFPCLLGEDARHTVPLTLITEYPDETLYGADFIRAHTVQMAAVIAAYDALQSGLLD